MFAEEALRPEMLLNFLSSFPANNHSVLLAHLQQAIRDISATCTRDLKAVAIYPGKSSVLATRVLTAQALVMAERASLERKDKAPQAA